MFLDFDGTLAEIASAPGHVRVEPSLPVTLITLHEALGGALALVSGRPIRDLDRFLDPARLPAAGLHGLERRNGGRTVGGFSAPGPALDRVRADLAALVAEDPRLVLEDKGVALALHYRQAPDREAECRRIARAAARRLDGYHVLAGKMVAEIKPDAAGKGAAIEEFMERPRFRDRRPLFAGDDVTDEDGFETVNRAGGISIKVGPGKTRASFRTPSVATLLAWLRELEGRVVEPAR